MQGLFSQRKLRACIDGTMDYSVEEFIILALCLVLQRAKLYPPPSAFITEQHFLTFQCYGAAVGLLLTEHVDLANFTSALFVLLHFPSQSWELFMEARALSSALKQLVPLHTIHGYGTAKPILLQVEILQCSLAFLVHQNDFFNGVISPEEPLRCFEFIPTHSGLQKRLEVY